MRTYFSAAMAMAVSTSAQHMYESFAPDSPLMAVGRLGEGLDMARPHYKTELDHGMHERTPVGIDHSRYFEPAHSAERGPIHHSERDHHGTGLYDFVHDVEAQDPKHIFHSAEQLPPLAPHAFDDRHHEAEQLAMHHAY